jgi:hypothetical protein
MKKKKKEEEKAYIFETCSKCKNYIPKPPPKGMYYCKNNNYTGIFFFTT